MIHQPIREIKRTRQSADERPRGTRAGAGVGILLAIFCGVGEAQLPREKPERLGFSSERLARIDESIRVDVDGGRIPGAVLLIARRGKLAYAKAFGYRDKPAGLPMTIDTIFDLTSMTKPLVSAGALILYERGELFLNDPVSKYLPALGRMPVAVLRTDPATGSEEALMRRDPATGQDVVATVPAKRPMNIQDLLRHTSGLTYGVNGVTAVHKLYPSVSYEVPIVMTGAEFVERLGGVPLLYQPGTKWEYSFSTDVLGLVIEKVTGRPLGEFLRDELFRPLGMTDACFHLSPEQAARWAKPLPNNPETGQPQSILELTRSLKFDCGGACAASTPGDYLRFAQMLADGGRLGGARVLGRKTVEYMTADHLGPDLGPNPLGPDPEDAGLGFGLGVAVRRQTGVAVVNGSAGDFYWLGAYGTEFWVDPKEKLVVVFMMAARGNPVRRYRKLIRALVLQALEN